jgi:hypothetical protein
MRGAKLLRAHLGGQDQARDSELTRFLPEMSLLADAFIYVALCSATMLCATQGTNLSRAFQRADPVSEEFVPVCTSDVRAAMALAIAVSAGDSTGISRAVSGVDIPTMINASYKLALGMLLVLARETNKSSEEWLDLMMGYAEHEINPLARKRDKRFGRRGPRGVYRPGRSSRGSR